MPFQNRHQCHGIREQQHFGTEKTFCQRRILIEEEVALYPGSSENSVMRHETNPMFDRDRIVNASGHRAQCGVVPEAETNS